MRTRMISLAIISILFATSVAVAGEKEGRNMTETQTVSSYLQKTIGYPSFAADRGIEGTVNVVVELNDEKVLQVSNVWGSDQRLVRYVERQLKHLERDSVSFPNEDQQKRYVLRFVIS